jgi:hypothetical protein
MALTCFYRMKYLLYEILLFNLAVLFITLFYFDLKYEANQK